MKTVKKNAMIANFNITFGDEEKPMLDYFDSIVYPAMISDKVRKQEDVEYLLKYVSVTKDIKDEYTLVGNIIKKTILEVKSDLDVDGELIEKDEKYSTAPYSTFAINLKNHRMIFVQNQKGSPTLANFRAMVAFLIRDYVKVKNDSIEETDKLPYAMVNIVGIPSARSIDGLLENVEKINSLTLRFYPLNGDIDYSGTFGILSKEMRNEVGSKNGEVVFKSPKLISGVKNVLEKAAGTIDPILKVVTKEKSKVSLKDYQMSEKYELDFEAEQDLIDERKAVVKKMKDISSLQYTNDEHERIYNNNLAKIIPFERRGEDN